MNGANRIIDQKYKQWRQFSSLFSVCYIILFTVLIYLLLTIDTYYKQQQERTYKEIHQLVIETLNQKNTITDEMNRLKQDHAFELVVSSKEGIIYQSLPIDSFDKLKGMFSTNIIGYEEIQEVSTTDETYYIWLAIYYPKFQSLLYDTFRPIAFIIVCVYILLIISNRCVFKHLIKPIRRVFNNIKKMQDYELNDLEVNVRKNNFDVLSYELNRFAVDLETKIEHINHDYSQLEQQLMNNELQLIKQKQWIVAGIHDLKTPLAVLALQLEMAATKQASLSKIQYHQMIERTEVIGLKIEEILQVSQQRDMEAITTKETFDIVALIDNQLKQFQEILEHKQLSYYIEAPRICLFHQNKIAFTYIIRNILSNAVKYATNGTSIDIKIRQEHNQLIINICNESLYIDAVDFKKVFNPLYKVKNESVTSQTGLGLYIVKVLVAQMQGDVDMSAEGAYVVLSLTFEVNND